jgi:hypothetical protein
MEIQEGAPLLTAFCLWISGGQHGCVLVQCSLAAVFTRSESSMYADYVIRGILKAKFNAMAHPTYCGLPEENQMLGEGPETEGKVWRTC